MKLLKKLFLKPGTFYKSIIDYFNYHKIFEIESAHNISDDTNKKVIAFSLYGNDPLYMIGALKNIEFAKKIYPDWILRFYIGNDVPNDKKTEIISSNAEVIIMRSQGIDNRYMLWRFLAACDPNIQVLIVRDADSRFTLREKDAVEEWCNSIYNFHIIRDHPAHYTRILGGMWGVKRNTLNNISVQMKKYNYRTNIKGMDQKFLAEVVYPIIKNDVMIHDSQHFYQDENLTPFKTQNKNNEYIGQIIND